MPSPGIFGRQLYEDWKPTPSDGVTFFIEDVKNRSPNNLRKRIYFAPGSRPTSTLRNIRPRLSTFSTRLFIRSSPDKPFMRHYLDYYSDMLLGPSSRREGRCGAASGPHESGRPSTQCSPTAIRCREVVYESPVTVRRVQPFPDQIDNNDDIPNGRIADPDKTITYYWLKNAGDGQYFAKGRRLRMLPQLRGIQPVGDSIFRRRRWPE